MGEIGHNKPPEMIVTAGEVTTDLSRWMAEHPVIQTDAEAKEAKVWLDRTTLCWKDMEDERKAKTGPLNEAVKEINDTFRGPRELLERVEAELRSRVDRFLVELESRKRAAAEAANLKREELKRIAHEAEAAERGGIENAAAGALDVDVAGLTSDADDAFAEYQAAEREADILERAAKVKVTGGFTRALSLRNRTLEHIDDPYAVMEVTGITPGIALEVLKAARAYKKIHGKYPPGIRLEIERRS